MRRLPLAFLACMSLGATVAVAQPQAAVRSTSLSVAAGEALQIALSGPVRDVVVGDPTVADVSVINERTLVVLGKKTGSTTLLAFDAGGRTLTSRQVVVSSTPSQAVIVQRGPAASTYACGDRCSVLTAETPPTGGADK